MRKAVTLLLLAASGQLPAAEPCRTIHGRLHSHGGNGQLRIWQIGTHHEFTPDQSTRGTVLSWLTDGLKASDMKKYAAPESAVDMFGDFEVCPTEPFRKGAVQEAKVMGVSRRRYVRTD